jgi:AcrR family transcriptional regulator
MTDTLSTATGRQRARTRQDLVDAAVRLIIAGEEPTMRSIAAEANVGERTIYRYFPNHEACTKAVVDHIAPRMGVPLCDDASQLEEYAERLFATFEANRELTIAFLQARWTAADLETSRRANLAAIHQLLADAAPDADADALRHAAATLRTVLSGSGWLYQRVSCGLPHDDVVANATWLIRLTLRSLTET